MKKVIYALILPLVVLGALAFAIRAFKNDPYKKPIPRQPSTAEMEPEKKIWETTPEGIKYKKWEASPQGKKVLADAAQLSTKVRDSSNMEAIVTDLSLPPGSRLGFGVMVSINGVNYILNFGPLKSKELQQLQHLKVNDKIVIKSRFVSYAPKYSYAIVTGDYVERDSKIIYKRIPNKGGC